MQVSHGLREFHSFWYSLIATFFAYLRGGGLARNLLLRCYGHQGFIIDDAA
jgi:hypothetical protein